MLISKNYLEDIEEQMACDYGKLISQLQTGRYHWELVGLKCSGVL